MPAKNFYLQLSFLSAFTALLIIGSRQMESLQSFSDLAWISLGLFVALSAAIYHIGYRAAKSPDKTLFTTVVMGFTMLKMMLALGILFGYMKIFNPASKLFILPFLGVYFFYTIFEVYFLSRLGKMSISNKP
ncbi:MAG TPA: hypothetical protein PKE06_22760 [Flavilitoribacter sp.]|nr:hypothetical protein [Lewinella sp.]MCB9282139.1 hypothetical protein [Lewinellaceae bacterium]HMQ63523.1 hypothetical protein [Flavilitoribacter sp.]HMQ90575.1 hypothetical protein [Flavilitoribacter sp.]